MHLAIITIHSWDILTRTSQYTGDAELPHGIDGSVSYMAEWLMVLAKKDQAISSIKTLEIAEHQHEIFRKNLVECNSFSIIDGECG